MKFLKKLFKKEAKKIAIDDKEVVNNKPKKKFKASISKEQLRKEHQLKKEANRKIIALAEQKKLEEEKQIESLKADQSLIEKQRREENMKIEREKNEQKKKKTFTYEAKQEKAVDLYGFEISTLEQGQMIKVEVLTKDREYYIVRSVDNYQEAFLPFNEVTIDVKINDVIDVLVYRHTNEDFHVSQKRFVQRTEAKEMLDSINENEVINAKIDKYNEPFFFATLSNGLKAKIYKRNIDSGFVSEFDKYVGNEYQFYLKSKVENSRDVKLELDRRSYLIDNQKNIIENVEVSSTIKVNLISANKGGIAAEYNAIRVFIPINELSHEYTSSAEEFLTSSNKTTDVKIIKIETNRGEYNIIASIKSLLPDPKIEFYKTLSVNDTFDGIISRIEKYGFFVEIAPFIRGLLHNNEMSPEIAMDFKKYKIGDKITVRVYFYDQETKKINLTTMREKEDQ